MQSPGPILARAQPPAIFVGRSADLLRLATATEHVRLVVVYGVAGVGKTSFLLQAGADLARRVGGRHIYYSCRPGDRISPVVGAIVAELRGGHDGARRDPFDALVRTAEEAPVVLILDDAHNTDDPVFVDAITHLARRRSPLWLCLGSRRSLPFSPIEVDHLAVRLGGLSRSETRDLWDALERLYGPARLSLDEVVARSHGNPLWMKHAFARRSSSSGASLLDLADLEPLEAELLAEVCAFRSSIHVSVLTKGRDAAAVARAVDRLASRFLVETSASMHVSVHDLVREQMVADGAVGPAQHGRCFAHFREQREAGRGSDSLEREELHHAVACGQDGRALEILVDHSSQLRRALPGDEVLERDLASAIDTLGARRALPASVKLLRARIRSRHGEIAQAFDEVTAVFDEGEPLMRLDLGEMAYSLGRLDEAVDHLEGAMADERLGGMARIWAWVVLVESHRARGDFARAERMLASPSSPLVSAGALGDAVRSWLQSIVLHDAEEHAAAANATASVRRHVDEAMAGPWLIPVVRSLERAIRAASGLPASDEENNDELLHDQFFSWLVARMARVEEAYYRGQMRLAASLGERVLETASAGGYLTLEWWAAWYWGEAVRAQGSPAAVVARLEPMIHRAAAASHRRPRARLQIVLARSLLALGHVDRAAALAQEASRSLSRAPGSRARAAAVIALCRAVQGRADAARAAPRSCGRAEGFDREEWRLARVEVLLWSGRTAGAALEAEQVEARSAVAGWCALARQARLLGAEAKLRQGYGNIAAAAINAALADAEREGCVADALRAALLDAAVRRARGAGPELARLFTEIRSRAEGHGLPVERAAADAALAMLEGRSVPPGPLGVNIAARLGFDAPVTCVLRAQGEAHFLTRSQAHALDTARFDLLIDLVDGRVRLGSKSVDLSRHPSLVRVLGVLARSADRVVPVDALAREAWGVEYHPIRHRSRVTVTLSRLRAAIGPRVVHGGPEGYRLVLPRAWAVIEPVPPPEV